MYGNENQKTNFFTSFLRAGVQNVKLKSDWN